MGEQVQLEVPFNKFVRSIQETSACGYADIVDDHCYLKNISDKLIVMVTVKVKSRPYWLVGCNSGLVLGKSIAELMRPEYGHKLRPLDAVGGGGGVILNATPCTNCQK